MALAKGVQIKGTMQVGQGNEYPLFLGTAIAPYGNTEKVDIMLSADGRNVNLRLDRESAIALATRILSEVQAETAAVA
jgi:hypothetical protein